MVYCSLACYQSEKHSGCSEAFYKDCVVNELSQMTSWYAEPENEMVWVICDCEVRKKKSIGEKINCYITKL